MNFTIKTVLLFTRMIHAPISFFRTLLGLKSIVQCTRNKIHYELDINEGIDFSIYLTGEYEPKVQKILKTFAKNGDTVIDIGANVGAHTLFLAKCVGESGQVYAFEPTLWAFNKLKKNCLLNKSFQISYMQIALIDTKGSKIPDQISSSWNLRTSFESANPLDMGYAKSTENCLEISLDQWVNTNSLEKLNLIKLDVDGFETRILRGAKQTLQKYRPIIICEWAPHHFINKEEPFSEMIEILYELNYEFYDFSHHKIIKTAREIENSIPKGNLVYVTAYPKEKKYETL